MLEPLSQVLPQIAVISAIAAFLGWMIRGLTTKPAPAKAAPSGEKSQPDRAKNLEASLEKSKAAHKTLKAELESLQFESVPKATHESIVAELESARKTLETETRRISAVETDLKKAQDTIKQLNARLNDGEKTQKDRSFALENELSKTREQLAILQNRPDDSAVLNAEIERLRESVAVSSRFAGEVRKREAAAVEALEKAEAKLVELSDPSRPATVSKKIGPVVDSGRIAAAKAEVIRLVEMNRQKEVAAIAEPVVEIAEPTAEVVEQVTETTEPVVSVIEEVVEITEPVVAAIEPTIAIADPIPVTPEAVLVVKKSPVHAELFSLD
jgi:DNA repair exonuclease SbcCD ATPase subunit